MRALKEFPVIETERLILSQLQEEDIPFVTEYLQDKIFSDLTSNIPYPYTREHAEFWLEMSRKSFEDNTGYTFAVRNKEGNILGAIGLHDRMMIKLNWVIGWENLSGIKDTLPKLRPLSLILALKNCSSIKSMQPIFYTIPHPEELWKKSGWKRKPYSNSILKKIMVTLMCRCILF
ncbi:hypothetical protein BN1195_00402 [Chryseobacterium oranimense G311]|nr:hypothetical protein BN1195_00402 [Chryseobacterium oranimense G311]